MQDKSTAHTAHQLEDEQPNDRETRECRSCYGGGQCLESRETACGWYESFPIVCPICDGTGQVSVYLYEQARRA